MRLIRRNPNMVLEFIFDRVLVKCAGKYENVNFAKIHFFLVFEFSGLSVFQADLLEIKSFLKNFFYQNA
jgi:hypothetical protein